MKNQPDYRLAKLFSTKILILCTARPSAPLKPQLDAPCVSLDASGV